MKWDWRGNLRDDCTAVGSGLMLRAEMMTRGTWWWAVYTHEGRSGIHGQVAASYDEAPHHAPNGKAARASAEAAAERYLSRASDRQIP